MRKRSMNFKGVVLLVALAACVASCRKDEEVVPSTGTVVTEGRSDTEIKGFFLLNEGNMGSNKASLDYFDYESGCYHRNIFAQINPTVALELGDVCNDIDIYGSKLYAVINCSNFVEVMDAATAKHITQISVPNCRYITFDGPYAYLSSYAGPVQIDPNARLGYVAKIDTASMTVIDTCTVGYQPEEMAVAGGKLYVANSGGYRVPCYDSTVSVIDLATFKEIKKIDVAINLHRMEVDGYGQLWVSSRSDYRKTPSQTYVIDTVTDTVIDTIDLNNSEMALCGDRMYVYSTAWSYQTGSNTVNYAVMDVHTRSVLPDRFITDGTERNITIPYGISVNPETGEVLVTDAVNYVTPGYLHCYSPSGRLKWSVTTGDIPAHMVFTKTKLRF